MPTTTREPRKRAARSVSDVNLAEPLAERWLPDESLGREDHLLVNPESLYTEPTPAFYLDMRRRVDAWFRERGLSKHAPARQRFKCALFFVVAATAYGLVLTEVVPRSAMLPLCMVSGMSLFVFAMSVAHDACHGAMSPKRWANMLWCYAYDLSGVSSHVTNMDHMKGHHRAPNVNGIDVAIGSDVELTLRLHPDIPHLPWHRFQHLYFPLAYALSTLHKWFILDYVELARNQFDVRAGRPGAARKTVIALGFKAFALFWSIGLPLMVMSVRWWEVALGVVAFHILPGLLVGLTFQLTHISEGNAFPSLGSDGRLPTSRPLHTLQTNLDVMPHSRWLNWFSCGLTLHVTHHLFPEVAHTYLPDIAPIVERTAIEHGVPYRKHPTLASAVGAHYRILRHYAAPPAARDAPAAT